MSLRCLSLTLTGARSALTTFAVSPIVRIFRVICMPTRAMGAGAKMSPNFAAPSVLPARNYFQMRRIDATSNTAEMVEDKLCRNLSPIYFESHAVSNSGLVDDLQTPITSIIHSAGPEPATAGWFRRYVAPEPFDEKDARASRIFPFRHCDSPGIAVFRAAWRYQRQRSPSLFYQALTLLGGT